MSISNIQQPVAAVSQVKPDSGKQVAEKEQFQKMTLAWQDEGIFQQEEKEGNRIAEVSEQEVSDAVEKANQGYHLTNTRFEFSVHEVTDDIMVKVIDEDTGETIREIPPEKVLDMVARMWELAGILVDERC